MPVKSVSSAKREMHPLQDVPALHRQALCINVQSDDVLETLSLVFCGASVNCDTGNPEFPTTISLAQSFNQKLQVELLSQNRNTGRWLRQCLFGFAQKLNDWWGVTDLSLTSQRFRGRKLEVPWTQCITWPLLPSRTMGSSSRLPQWHVQSQSGSPKKVRLPGKRSTLVSALWIPL